MIIDAHVHLGGSYTWFSYVHDESFVFETPLGPRKVFGPEVFLRVMEDLKIDKAVIMPTKVIDNDRENEETLDTARRYPDRFFAFPILNPIDEQAVEKLTRYVKELGAKGLKLLPYAHSYMVYSPIVHPLVEQAIKLKIPVYIHSGTAPFCTPLQVAMVADTFPDATIIMSHMGISHIYAYEARYSAEKYENIILETSNQPTGMNIKRAIENVGADRVVFGSDTPWLSTEAELMKLKVLRLPEDMERRVLGESMAKILGLKVV